MSFCSLNSDKRIGNRDNKAPLLPFWTPAVCEPLGGKEALRYLKGSALCSDVRNSASRSCPGWFPFCISSWPLPGGSASVLSLAGQEGCAWLVMFVLGAGAVLAHVLCVCCCGFWRLECFTCAPHPLSPTP